MLHTPPLVESDLSADALAAKDAYLALINPNHRSHVTNLFLEQARAGLHKPSDILARVLGETRRRLTDAQGQGDAAQVEKWAAILPTLARPEALDFAAYAIHYSRLPAETRARMKARRGQLYADAHMEGQPATASQLVLLRRLGWTGAPTVNTRAEAAALIDALMRGKGARRG